MAIVEEENRSGNLLQLSTHLLRVTTCLENLENLEMSLSGNSKHVREMSGMLLTVRELSGKCQGKNLVMEKCPKTVHYWMNICVNISITFKNSA